VNLVDPAQAVEVLVDEHDLGLHPGRDPRRVPADVARPEHDDLGRTDAGRAAHQHAAAALVALEEVGALLGREPARDLAHRGEERQRAVVDLHRLVGEGRRPAGEQGLGDFRVGGQVEVGEQGQVGAEEPELLLHRLLDLHHHLLRPGVLGPGHDVGARSLVVGVGDRRPLTGTGLDAHLDPVAFELPDPVRGHRHPVLGGLDLLRHADRSDRCRHRWRA
jgi:hypothetical protein